jgi:Rieske 2Fe-2S protein
VPPGFRDTSPVHTLRKLFAGHQCAAGKGGWICPHRKASLGSIQPVDGIITCPLHGLRIDAATGKMLGVPESFS